MVKSTFLIDYLLLKNPGLLVVPGVNMFVY